LRLAQPDEINNTQSHKGDHMRNLTNVVKFYEARQSVKGWNVYNKETNAEFFTRFWKTRLGAENAMNTNHIIVQLADGFAWSEKQAELYVITVFSVTAGQATEINRLKEYPMRGSFSSVVSYALESGRDPIEAIEFSKTRGDNMHWFNFDCICISNRPITEKGFAQINIGDIVRFEGRHFVIVANGSEHVKFIPWTQPEGTRIDYIRPSTTMRYVR